MKTSFKTLAEFKAAYKAQGLHFFDRKTMQFFNSRIETGLLSGKYFITSESDMRNTERFYNIREIGTIAEGESAGEFTINTIGSFNTLKSKSAAKHYLNGYIQTSKILGE